VTGEHFCSMMEVRGVQTASLRISAPYGEFSKAKTVLNIFLEKALNNHAIQVHGSGRREQNFTYAGDVLRAIELCLKHDTKGIYEIVAQKNTTMVELARLIIEMTNSSSQLQVGKIEDPQENYAPNYSYERAKRELGYKPEFSLRKGLENYIKWHKKQPGYFMSNL
ncbi:NAD-dependent epimerase/dehydratase family protein, partial [Alphaproteobacteria bacterium]|nr:NAD-dependent epimerase/dehydratase family protein [Alphaproteobacteria bacterium]